MSTTTDPNDPRLTHGADSEPGQQNEAYLVLPEAERAKGFVRPLRFTYVHVGPPGPRRPLRDLTDAEAETYAGSGYVRYETYPPEAGRAALGRFWTQAQLDKAALGCGAVTRMAEEIAATYARSPGFYGATWCIGCSMHLDVGPRGEFVWDGTDERVGT